MCIAHKKKKKKSTFASKNCALNMILVDAIVFQMACSLSSPLLDSGGKDKEPGTGSEKQTL